MPAARSVSASTRWLKPGQSMTGTLDPSDVLPRRGRCPSSPGCSAICQSRRKCLLLPRRRDGGPYRVAPFFMAWAPTGTFFMVGDETSEHPFRRRSSFLAGQVRRDPACAYEHRNRKRPGPQRKKYPFATHGASPRLPTCDQGPIDGSSARRYSTGETKGVMVRIRVTIPIGQWSGGSLRQMGGDRARCGL
jgi:hypothetical protein